MSGANDGADGGSRHSALGARRLVRAGIVALVVAWPAAAQVEPKFQPEARIDLFFASTTTAQIGGGGAWELDRNVRLAVDGAVGSTFSAGVGAVSARADVLGRFVLDPDRSQRWALYGAAGLGVRYETAPSWRGVIVALVGLEGPRWGTYTPFIEAGWGGGVQVGFGLRRARRRGR